MSSFTRQQLERWLKTLTLDGHVLDIGGAQEPLQKRIGASQKADFKILDLEVPHELKQMPDIVWDLNEIGVERKYPQYHEYFDVVACLEVTEYLYNPVQAFQTIEYFLKKGARLIASFHFNYPVHSPKGQDYLRYTEYGARKILEHCGFELTDFSYRTANDAFYINNFYQSEMMHPLKGYDHSNTGYLVQAKKR